MERERERERERLRQRCFQCQACLLPVLFVPLSVLLHFFMRVELPTHKNHLGQLWIHSPFLYAMTNSDRTTTRLTQQSIGGNAFEK